MIRLPDFCSCFDTSEERHVYNGLLANNLSTRPAGHYVGKSLSIHRIHSVCVGIRVGKCHKVCACILISLHSVARLTMAWSYAALPVTTYVDPTNSVTPSGNKSRKMQENSATTLPPDVGSDSPSCSATIRLQKQRDRSRAHRHPLTTLPARRMHSRVLHTQGHCSGRLIGHPGGIIRTATSASGSAKLIISDNRRET